MKTHNVNGKVVALSNNTIAFIPEKKLEQSWSFTTTAKARGLMAKKHWQMYRH